MILYLFAWMKGNGFEQAALPAAQALYAHLSWVVTVSEVMMLPPFLCWFYLVTAGKTELPKKMALSNPLTVYLALYLVKSLEEQISVYDTTIHCFYAAKMGEKYLHRYKKYFKNPVIHRFEMGHEELLVFYPEQWALKVKEVCL